MRLFLYLMIVSISLPLQAQESIIGDLRTEVANLEDGSKLLLEYTFEGCYGPYHHGTVALSCDRGVIEYLSSSFDHQNQPGIAQSSSYSKEALLKLLHEAQSKQSSKVFGNAISYRISTRGHELLRGADRIEQRHFIQLFEPFTSVFPKKQDDIVPKISSGGFVH